MGWSPGSVEGGTLAMVGGKGYLYGGTRSTCQPLLSTLDNNFKWQIINQKGKRPK